MVVQNLNFRPSARILSQIGDQLIRNERVAVLELVKNSYDADSPYVRVSFKKADNPHLGTITIYDEGEGMDMDTIQNKWLIIGTDSRKTQYDQKQRTPKYGRMPLGEKGIGRFAVQKLGSVTEITSRREDKKEIFVRIDWGKLETVTYLDEVTIGIEEREPVLFKGEKTGTQIVVHSLRLNWDIKAYRRFYEDSLNFSSPFEKESEFTVEVESDNKEWDSGIPRLQDFIDDSLYRFSIDFQGEFITKFVYRFTPSPSMDKVKPREITEENATIAKVLRIVDFQGEKVDLSNYAIGPIHFEGYIYDRDPVVLKMSTTEGPTLKKYLNDNGGIRVYRGGIRVYDYGELGNDWLELGSRRINQPTFHISNNIILGAVSLDREKSGDLKEKTNREGFIENDAFKAFRKAVEYVLTKVETLRNMDKRDMRTVYGKETKEVLTVTGDFKEVIEKRVNDNELKAELLTYLDRIETGYTAIRETFIKSASAGLSIGIAIHEIQKVIKEIETTVKRDNRFSELRPIIKRISDLVEGYGYLLRKSHRVYQPLSNVIEIALFDVDYRLKAHGIRVIKGNMYSKYNPKFSRQMIIGALLNIIDNSIWWLDYGEKSKEKLIFLSVVESEKSISLIIADNGPGFTLPVEVLGEPFISGKPDGTGLGLHVVKTIMQINEGSLNFPEASDFKIPDEFKNGAIVELRFGNVEAR